MTPLDKERIDQLRPTRLQAEENYVIQRRAAEINALCDMASQLAHPATQEGRPDELLSEQDALCIGFGVSEEVAKRARETTAYATTLERQLASLTTPAGSEGDLSREQIEDARKWRFNYDYKHKDALCNMALTALTPTQEAPASESVTALVEAALKAVEDEPEFPGDMPAGFRATFEKLPLDEALRIVVALTKSGIRGRIKALAAYRTATQSTQGRGE